MADKLWRLRIFEDPDSIGVGDLAASDINAPLLVISQFTLYGDTRKGRPRSPAADRMRRVRTTLSGSKGTS